MATPAFRDFLLRDNLLGCARRFVAGGSARVAFLGGSVTTQSWRQPVMEFLRQQFPATRFDFVMAGLGGTDANLGAFRLGADVFARGPVDLLWIDFAVNGGGVRALEGIVRQARAVAPNIDIVLLYFASAPHVESFRAGQAPRIVEEHEKVATWYGLPSLHLFRDIARRVLSGSLRWEDFSRDSVHPTEEGCRLYGEAVCSFLEQACTTATPAPKARPERPLDPRCYDQGHFVHPTAAKVWKTFRWEPGWTTSEPVCNFRPPWDVLVATQPGAALSFSFEGTAVGLYGLVGGDAGRVQVQVDYRPAKVYDLFDNYCLSFHRPQHLLIADDLPPGSHELQLTVAESHHPQSRGTAVRIAQFLVNGPT
ncbi:MAG: hypothetical protein IT204_22855 [Fimbriimonadaceae bacterium]|nr:hypothetical protein [Fimbriimonadaceae bacterium]